MPNQLIEAAIQLGVIPTLALLLVFGFYRQNQQLLRDRRDMEKRLLEIVSQIQSDYRDLLLRTYREGKKAPSTTKENPRGGTQ